MNIIQAEGRTDAQDLARWNRSHGRYALASFRPEHGGWVVVVKRWA